MQVFITGIGTDVGKTLVAAIFCRAWQADYWKPVQTGDPASRDAETVRRLVRPPVLCHPEGVCLRQPLSPHAAAEIEGKTICCADFVLPRTSGNLVVEGAGGVLVPLNARETMADLILKFGLPVVLVSRHYLGSINHTLLSVRFLESIGVTLLGLVFNGSPLPGTEDVIRKHSGLPVLLRLEDENDISAGTVNKYAAQLQTGSFSS